MYAKKIFGTELKDRVLQKECIVDIGHWCYSVYLKNMHDIDLEFRDILLALNTMEDGAEFAFSYERLEQIANALIAGEQVNL